MRQGITRFLALVALLAAIVWGVSNYQGYQSNQSQNLKLWFFNVGEGDAMMFDTPNHHQVMIDGGPDNSVLRLLGQALPLSDKEIDLLVISHNHADHIAGAIEIMKHYRVDQVWLTGAVNTTTIYKNMVQIIKDKNIPITYVKAGQTFEQDGLNGIAIYPVDSIVGQTSDEQNTLSLVTYWQYGNTTALITGDAEKEQEKNMLQKNLVRPVTILKVAHQGSQTSSSIEFLQTLKPKFAVIMVGLRNQYGHPHQAVLDRFKQLGTTVLRTDQDKTIRFDISTTGYSYKTGI
jgi:competence protein ComEC